MLYKCVESKQKIDINEHSVLTQLASSKDSTKRLGSKIGRGRRMSTWHGRKNESKMRVDEECCWKLSENFMENRKLCILEGG